LLKADILIGCIKGDGYSFWWLMSLFLHLLWHAVIKKNYIIFTNHCRSEHLTALFLDFTNSIHNQV